MIHVGYEVWWLLLGFVPVAGGLAGFYLIGRIVALLLGRALQ